MKAMENIDDPRLFVNKNESTQQPAAAPVTGGQAGRSENLLNKFKTV